MDLRSVFGDIKGRELSQELGHAIETVRLSLGQPRSWGEFFAELKKPHWTRKHLEQRIITNFIYYRSNYLLICLGILAFKVIVAPAVLLSLLMVASIFIYFFMVVKEDMIFMETKIDLKGKQIICGVGTIIIISISGTMEHILRSLLYGLSFCLIHMIFRPRNILSKSNRIGEEFGGDAILPDLEGTPGPRKRSSSSSSSTGGDGASGSMSSPKMVAISANHGYIAASSNLGSGAAKSD